MITALAVAAAPAACNPDHGPTISEAADPEAANPHGCADVFAPGLLPSFAIEITDADWAAMTAEFQDWKTRQDQSLETKPYHPITFHYGDEVYSDAFIKLQGNPSTSWMGNKMQFTIAFDKLDDSRRFHGLRKLVLHASPPDQTFLRERVSLSFMRGLGLPAECENSARLTVNGRYYGVYSNRESVDGVFLGRVFPGASSGDLWKGGWSLDNNGSSSDPARHNAFMMVKDSGAMASLGDVDEALSEWAAEAVLPDSDGYWGLAHNFYLYDHPTRGFLWLPYDVDATFDFVPFDADPILWTPSWSSVGWGIHQQVAMADPALRARYVDAVERALGGYDIDVLKSRLLRWDSQIAGSVADDQQKPFSTGDHDLAVARVDGYLWERQKLVSSWLQCIRSGAGVDADHDGVVWCLDCNDHDAAVNPGATEICGNNVDENCNGRKDDCP